MASQKPSPPGDALAAGRVNAPRPLRPPPLAASHHHRVLTPPLAAATAAPERAPPPGGSTPDPSAQRLSLVSAATMAWRSPSRWSAGAVAMARVGWHGASRNYT